jgi:hypothetical protein
MGRTKAERPPDFIFDFVSSFSKRFAVFGPCEENGNFECRSGLWAQMKRNRRALAWSSEREDSVPEKGMRSWNSESNVRLIGPLHASSPGTRSNGGYSGPRTTPFAKPRHSAQVLGSSADSAGLIANSAAQLRKICHCYQRKINERQDIIEPNCISKNIPNKKHSYCLVCSSHPLQSRQGLKKGRLIRKCPAQPKMPI